MFYHFLQYHHSFTAVDPLLGPLILSVCLEEEENRLRVILRFLSILYQFLINTAAPLLFCSLMKDRIE